MAAFRRCCGSGAGDSAGYRALLARTGSAPILKMVLDRRYPNSYRSIHSSGQKQRVISSGSAAVGAWTRLA
jgi:hypothetical protein